MQMTQLDPVMTWIASIALAIVFGASAAMKLADLGEFRGAVENYRVLPNWLAAPAAAAIPMLEAAGAAAMLITALRPFAVVTLAAMLALFTGAVVVNLMRGRRDIDCGCFGTALRQRLSGALVARNAALALIIWIAAMPDSARPMGALDVLTIGGAAASIVVLYAAANLLLANAPMLREPVISDA